MPWIYYALYLHEGAECAQGPPGGPAPERKIVERVPGAARRSLARHQPCVVHREALRGSESGGGALGAVFGLVD